MFYRRVVVLHILTQDRQSCQGDEGLSIDETALVSVDSDARIWAEHIL